MDGPCKKCARWMFFQILVDQLGIAPALPSRLPASQCGIDCKRKEKPQWIYSLHCIQYTHTISRVFEMSQREDEVSKTRCGKVLYLVHVTNANPRSKNRLTTGAARVAVSGNIERAHDVYWIRNPQFVLFVTRQTMGSVYSTPSPDLYVTAAKLLVSRLK